MLSECIRCGVCCVKYQAPLTIDEVSRVSAFLKLTTDEFTLKFIDSRWQGKEKLLAQQHGYCPFLDYTPDGKTNNCRIHNVRPSACRDWAPGPDRQECREGLSNLWQLTLDDSGNLTGDTLQLSQFRQFLYSLDKARQADE